MTPKSPAPIDSAKVEDTGEPVAWTADALYDAIEEVLLHHRMSNFEGDDGEAYPLVDQLTTTGADSVESGQFEIRLICDAIYNEVLTVATPTPSTQAVEDTGEPEKIAPVQGYTPGIPWSLHLEAYAAYSKKWSPQPAMIDLEGRNCRGGFGVGELDEFIPGWRDRVSEIGMLKARVDELEAQIAALLANGATK